MNEEKGKRAWALHSEIIANEKQRRNLLLSNMALINVIHSDKLYQDILGDETAPWSAYLGQNETFYSASKVYTMDKVYQKFTVELGADKKTLSNIPLTKLSNLLPIVNKDNVVEWLTKAETLTSQDFNDEIRIATGKVSYLNCEHKDKVNYEICQTCGFRHRH